MDDEWVPLLCEWRSITQDTRAAGPRSRSDQRAKKTEPLYSQSMRIRFGFKSHPHETRPSDQEEASDGPKLLPLLREGLTVVFVDIGPEPGGKSLGVGHYYADARNQFYCSLHESGWTPYELSFEEDANLPHYGIGLADLCGDPQLLVDQLQRVSPRCVCFNSKQAYGLFARHLRVDPRRAPWKGRHADENLWFRWRPARAWALPGPSHKDRFGYGKRVRLLAELREAMLISDRRTANQAKSSEPQTEPESRPQSEPEPAEEIVVWLTLGQAADLMGKDVKTLRTLIDETELEADWHDGQWWISEKEAKSYKNWESAEGALNLIVDVWKGIKKHRQNHAD